MQVDTLTVGPYESNCYIVSQDAAALVIDPGDDAERIIAHIEQARLQLSAILVTHGHLDHINALCALYEYAAVPVAMHPVDMEWAFGPMNALPPFFCPPRKPARIERLLAEGQEWEDAGLRYTVLALPGHSPGHVGFYFPDHAAMFSGDVLFESGVGRTDLPGGDEQVLQDSLDRLCRYPDDTVVYCGHGPATTIGREKQTNPWLRFS